MFAAMLMPEMACTEDEAQREARAFVAWRSHYESQPINPATMALLTLLGVTAAIEIPKVRAGLQRKAAERSASRGEAVMRGEAMGTVVQMDPTRGFPQAGNVPGAE
jgi:hypothetical protein